MSATGSVGTVSKLATGASLLTGTVLTLTDAVKGFKKSSEWFENDNFGSKISSAIGSALGGTGKGIGQEGATIGGVAKNIGGNALKGGTLGFAIAGPLGAAIGAGIGAVAGGIGGERIAKGFRKIGELGGKAIKTGLELNPITNIIGKQFDAVKNNFKETTGELSEIWSDNDKNLIQKFGATFGTIKQGLSNTGKEIFKSIGNGVEDSIIGKGYNSLKKFGKGVKNFIENPFKSVNKVLEKSEKLINAFLHPIETAKNGIKNIKSKVNNIAENNDKKKDKENYKNQSSGSHASGLNYVPYDGYLAKLHKGETIFNEKASKQIQNLLGIYGTTVSDKTSLIKNNIFDQIGTITNKIKNNSKRNESQSKEQNDSFRRLSESILTDYQLKFSNLDKSDRDNKMSDTINELKNSKESLNEARSEVPSDYNNFKTSDNSNMFDREKNNNMFDTSSLESAIYAIGDKIVKAIENNSTPKSSNNSIINKKTGTVNVRFNSENEGSLAPTLLG